MFALWKRLRDYSSKKYAQAYSSRYGSEKCPNCNRWTYEMTTPPVWSTVGHSDHMKCNDCGYESVWTMGPGLMLLVGDNPSKDRGCVQ